VASLVVAGLIGGAITYIVSQFLSGDEQKPRDRVP